MPLEVLIILFCGSWLLCIFQLIAPIVRNDHRRVERSDLFNRIGKGWRGRLGLTRLTRAAARNAESWRQHDRCRQLRGFSSIATHRANSFALPREVRSVCRSSARSAWLWLSCGWSRRTWRRFRSRMSTRRRMPSGEYDSRSPRAREHWNHPYCSA